MRPLPSGRFSRDPCTRAHLPDAMLCLRMPQGLDSVNLYDHRHRGKLRRAIVAKPVRPFVNLGYHEKPRILARSVIVTSQDFPNLVM